MSSDAVLCGASISSKCLLLRRKVVESACNLFQRNWKDLSGDPRSPRLGKPIFWKRMSRQPYGCYSSLHCLELL